VRITPEQRASLERLRRLRNYGGEELDFIGENEGSKDTVISLALALFPADDEEIATAEWFSSVKPTPANFDAEEALDQFNEECLAGKKTRGDVRRLLQGLGVDAKGGG